MVEKGGWDWWSGEIISDKIITSMNGGENDRAPAKDQRWEKLATCTTFPKGENQRMGRKTTALLTQTTELWIYTWAEGLKIKNFWGIGYKKTCPFKRNHKQTGLDIR